MRGGFPGGSYSKESAHYARRPGFDPWFRKIPWRRKWQPTPVFLSEFLGQRSLAGYSPWVHKESDTTRQVTHTHIHHERNSNQPYRAIFYKILVISYMKKTERTF